MTEWEKGHRISNLPAKLHGLGIGDLRGIIQKLESICELGVEILWLSFVYDSPNDDNGYDIQNYYKIMAEFGTMADFDKLLKEIYSRDMKNHPKKSTAGFLLEPYEAVVYYKH